MSTTTLKRIALICMIIDHIGEFIPGMPIQLRWIGRLSAPIFIYLFVNGIAYTSNKKKFIKRLYSFNVLTAFLMFGFNLLPEHQGLFNLVTNNILGTFLAIFLLIEVIETVREKKKNWGGILCGYCFWQIVSILAGVILEEIPVIGEEVIYLFWQLSGNIFMNEGRLFIVVLGVGLYYARNSKKKLTLTYLLIVGSQSAIVLLDIPYRICAKIHFWEEWIPSILCENIFSVMGYEALFRGRIDPFAEHFEWMMMAALPFLLMYNGERGKYHKYFYYIFYPAHLVLLLSIQHILG